MNFARTCAIGLLSYVSLALAVPDQINYQGLLTASNGSPMDTTISITFSLYNLAVGGTALWTETSPAVSVQNGLFNVSLGTTTPLDDAVLGYPSIWLGITVGDNSEMTPRTQLSSVPYAYRVATVDASIGGEIEGNVLLHNGSLIAGSGNDGDYDHSLVVGSANEVFGSHSSVTGGVEQRTDSAYSFIGGGQTNRTLGRNSAIAGGTSNTSGSSAFVGGGQLNTATGNYSVIGGGSENNASGWYSTVAGGQFCYARGAWSVVGGGGSTYPWDSCSAIGSNSTVSGGLHNAATADESTIGGGYSNLASGALASIGGGAHNTANLAYATVGGGWTNTAGASAAVAGGYQNTASGQYAAVGGGSSNLASGNSATVPGGYNCEASGNYSFAAGHNAQAGNNGVFAWADDNPATFAPGLTNSFNARASGSFRFYTNAASTLGAQLPANGTAWVAICDSTQKQRYGRVNTGTVLEKVSHLPIEIWSYKEDPSHVTHMGPMAQDFYAVFGLGESDTTISTLDPDGVALAAIQELAKENAELRSRLVDVEAQLRSMKEDKQLSLTQEP